jgi:hypothetical protein
MDVLRVQAALLRANMPDLVLRPGLMLPAKVLERAGQHGLLLLAGTPLSAELPDELQAGARLRLRVEEVTGDRIVLRAVDTPAAPGAQPLQPPPPDVALPLPGGRQAEVRVTERADEKRAGGEPVSVALDYDSPALGTLDLRLVLQPGARLTVTVGAVAGAPEERVRAAADGLRAALAEATGLPASVRVVGRAGGDEFRVDLYA